MKRSAIAFARGGADDADAGAGEDCVERGRELAVPVTDQETKLVGPVAEVHDQVAGLLGDPGPGGVGGDPGEVCTRRVPCSTATRM